MDRTHMAAVAEAYSTISDKIRALNAAGYARAEIAYFLGKRYQHVRNVLIAPPPKGSPFAPSPALTDPSGSPRGGVSESPQEPFKVEGTIALLRLPVTESGALQLPPETLVALGLRPSGLAIAELDGDRLVVFSVGESIRRVQALVRDLVPGDHSLVDGLIADRRAEASRDDG